MGTFRDFVRTFSFRSSLKSNIVSIPGSYSTSSINSLGISGSRNSGSNRLLGSKFLSSYYDRMKEIQDYIISELTNTVVGIFKDYITTYFNEDITELVSSSDPSLAPVIQKINTIFTQLNYVGDCKRHLFDVIYQGSYCYKVEWNSQESKYEKVNLINPYNVVDVYKSHELTSHLIVADTGKVVEVKPESIIRIGGTDLDLVNDVNPDFNDEPDGINKSDEKDKLTIDVEFLASTPLYYNISDKIKEFLLKDKVVSLLAIKDLIQPLLLLINVDKNTPVDVANQLALNTENLINKYVDISSILTVNFSIADLMDSLINNVRVLPDYNGGMGQMNDISLDKIYNKIEQIRQEQDASKETILTSIGIPMDLFTGRLTRIEAIKTSERLNSRINSFCRSIDEGIKMTAAQFYKVLTGNQVSPDVFEVNLFNKTIVEFNAAQNSIELVSNLFDWVVRTIDSANQFLATNDIANPTELLNYLSDKLATADPDLGKLITPTDIQNAVVKINQKKQQQEGGY